METDNSDKIEKINLSPLANRPIVHKKTLCVRRFFSYSSFFIFASLRIVDTLEFIMEMQLTIAIPRENM